MTPTPPATAWTPERVIAAMAAHDRRYGRWPSRRDWRTAAVGHPSYAALTRIFRSVPDAHRAAAEALITANYRPQPDDTTGRT